jgi:hypothetical protein
MESGPVAPTPDPVANVLTLIVPAVSGSKLTANDNSKDLLYWKARLFIVPPTADADRASLPSWFYNAMNPGVTKT